MNAVVQEAPRARIIECTDEEYFRDPCAVPSLSQSIAHTLITKSPLHAWTEHPRLGNASSDIVEDDSDAVKSGNVIHKLLLGKGVDVVIVQADNFRKKAARMARDEALEAGKLPMIERKYDEIVCAADTIKANLITQFGIDLEDPDGQSEVAIEWSEQGEKDLVLCRGRMDRVNLKTGLIIDIKKILSAHPETCGKHAIEYGRDIQNAAYTSALEHLLPELAGRVQMLFVHVEVEPPYAILPGPLDGELRELGRQRWERAVMVWERCLRTNVWPAYADRLTPIQAPGWAAKRWIEIAQNW